MLTTLTLKLNVRISVTGYICIFSNCACYQTVTFAFPV